MDEKDDEFKIYYLFSEGHNLEDKFNYTKAQKKFEKAWRIAKTNLEKYIASRNIAGYQKSFEAQLEWHLKSIEYGLNIDDETVMGMLPSHYHDIGECYEELKDYENARASYILGRNYLDYLPTDKDGIWVIDALYVSIERMNQMGF